MKKLDPETQAILDSATSIPFEGLPMPPGRFVMTLASCEEVEIRGIIFQEGETFTEAIERMMRENRGVKVTYTGPSSAESIWECACGEWMRAEDTRCFKCSAGREIRR
jgi:hypothetical protein